MYILNGILEEKKDVQHISDRFKKREFVVRTGGGKYSEYILFQLTQDNCDIINEHTVGSEVLVHFAVKGRKWQKSEGSEVKYFNTLDAWRVEHGSNKEMYDAIEKEC